MGVTLAIDCMGGDHGPSVTVPAALAFLKADATANVILVGRPDAVQAQFESARGGIGERLLFQPASEVVGMDDPPAIAMRNKKDSSMRVAINLVKEGKADACVSAGNTGALMAISRFVLKTLPGIERPAIAKMLPNVTGGTTCVLDLGANVDCTPEQLVQFGIMGAMLFAAVRQKERPSVGLLTIGSEEIKGNEVVTQASDLLRNAGLRFHGNVEGNDIYKGTVDVVVCDGFIGNIALKTSEGLASMIATLLREEFKRNWLTRLAALLAYPVLRRFRERVDSRRYNGASLLGLRGIVVKSHGGADELAFQYAIEQAVSEVKNRVLQRIEHGLSLRTPAAASGES